MKTATSEPDSSRALAMIERMATDPSVDPAKLREILAVKQNWEADEARKAFARDMAEFQSRCPIIAKNDIAHNKAYARIDRIHRETRDLRKECGFWFAWQKCEIAQGMATMEGILGHRGGHTISIKQTVPVPDKVPGMNETQRAGAAMTYAKRYGECLALDIVSGEDTDGGSAKPKPAVDASQPSQPLPNEDERKKLAAELWELLKSERGADRNWVKINHWLWREEILDAAAEESMPNLEIDRLKAVVEAVKKKGVK